MQFTTKTLSKRFINKEISSIGFDEGYINSAIKKHMFISIKIFNLTPPQAAILKQTALSSNCDCAVNRGVIDCSIDYSDCILSGTLSQIKTVANKLTSQPFSLKKLSEALFEQLNIQEKQKNNSKIMGILNLTPDSFSDGGEFVEIEKAINHAIDMIESGASVIDIGAQSTKPQADLVSAVYEIEKVIPIVNALKTAFPHIEISVDTMTLSCAAAALDAGADIINDVSFLSNPEFAKICADKNRKLIIMHSRGNSKTMDSLTNYDNIVDDVYKEIKDKISIAKTQGLQDENIIIDPGFGFAKTITQNLELLNRICEFKALGYPLAAGVSRKRFMQDMINTKEPKDADFVTAIATSYLIQNNVNYIRVHNVDLSMEALKFNERLFSMEQLV